MHKLGNVFETTASDDIVQFAYADGRRRANPERKGKLSTTVTRRLDSVFLVVP